MGIPGASTAGWQGQLAAPVFAKPGAASCPCHPALVVWVALGLLAGCPGLDVVDTPHPGPDDDDTTAGDDDDTGDDDTTAADDDTGDDDTVAPFTCEPAAVTSPVLNGEMYFDPADPHPGDTLTVIVKAPGQTPDTHASMAMKAEGSWGEVLEPTTIVAGGGDTFYYYAIPDVQLGEVCLLGLIDGVLPEISGEVLVTERPQGAPLTQGVYRVTSNHQWTCGEQPTYGNEVHVQVLDEQGNGVPNTNIAIHYADSTDPGTIYNGGGDIPEFVTTDGNGSFVAYNSWPISDHGFLVFQLWVKDEPSDIATELTTGWWETDDQDCSYCGQYGINVWGHWSHSVVFQRDPAATEACTVPVDHGGQAACGAPGHLHHHPTHQACWSLL
jgi:hypothetical protein